MKIFISQPMRGRSENEILKERSKVIADLKELYGDDIEIIDSYFDDYVPSSGIVALKYLARALELMANADIVCFVGDWTKTRGCNVEYICAEKYGMNVMRL